jgi:Sigma-70 region 2
MPEFACEYVAPACRIGDRGHPAAGGRDGRVPGGIGDFTGGGIAGRRLSVLGGEDGRWPVDERTRRDFGEFVAARSPELLRLAYVLTGDQHAAEDLLQSALTKAAAHWGRIRDTPEG